MISLRKKVSRLASWSLFLGVLFTVGTGFDPGSLTRSGCERVKAPGILKSFMVTVLDAETGQPIPGAEVQLDDRTAVSSAGGTVTFAEVAEGLALLVARHPEYSDASAQLILTTDQTGTEIRLHPLRHAASVSVPVADISTFESDPITTNHRDDPALFFESAAATLAHQASIVTYINLLLSAIPGDAIVTRVILHGHLIAEGLIVPPGGGGGDSAPSRTHLAPRSTQDEDVALEAYGVLQPWSTDDLNFLNKPVDFTDTPVATAIVAAATPTDAAGLKAFTMDLTQFVNRVRSGALQAHGFVVAGRDIVGPGGSVQVLGMTSSEYTPAEGALSVTAEYTTAAGKTVEVSLR